MDKNKVLLGQPFTLTIEARIPTTGNLQFPVIDSIPHFEFVGDRKLDSTKEATFLRIRAQYQLISFDSGHWVIPSFALSRRIISDTIPMDVVYSEFDPKQSYHELRDIIPVEEAELEKKMQWWYYAIAGGVLLAFILYLVVRKKPAKPVSPAIVLNAYERAKKQLAQLQGNRPVAKAYYSELTEIFRQYVSDRKGIRSLQNTTDDLVVQLRGLYNDKSAFDSLAQALRLADFVKFAKYVPNADDDRMAFETISRAIDDIEKVPDAV